MKRIFTFGFLLFALLLLGQKSSVAQETEEPAEPEVTVEEADVTIVSDTLASDTLALDIVSTLEAEGNFTTLLGALERTGLTEQLSEAGSYTLFAPTDEAFAALPENTIEEMSDEELLSVLKHHVLNERVTLELASLSGEVATTAETMLKVNEDGTMIGNATIAQADIEASNGIIHAIDTVLIPPAKQPN